MESELIYGTYIFFLLIGVGLGLLVGWLVGFVTAMKRFDYEFNYLDPDDYAHEESLSSDNSQLSTVNSQLPTQEARCQ